MSTIVLQELWAGVRNDSEAHDLSRLRALARRVRTLLNPTDAAWVLSGQALARLRSRRNLGAARLRGLRNDALLAASAMLANAAVLTSNRRDFELIAEELAVSVVPT